MNLKELQPRLIGTIGVDAGLVWIGDPCYIMHKDKLPKSIGENWEDFCNILNGRDKKSFDYDAGHEGLGVVTSTKHGDGSFNVIGFYESEMNDRPSCVMIDFDDVFFNEEDDCEVLRNP